MAVGPLPILPVKPPSDLNMTGNSGMLTPDQLVVIGPSGKLHHTAARAWRALCYLCSTVGLPLTYTYGGTYRSYADQVTLFGQRYTKTFLAGRPAKTWNGVKYYLLPGMASAATPGESNHGWGLAIDTAFDNNPSDGIGPDDAAGITGHPQWEAFKGFALACGFSWETVPSEPWHIRLVTGDNPTQAVLDAEAAQNPTPTPVEDDDMIKRLRVADDAAVFYLDGLTAIWASPAAATALEAVGLAPAASDEIVVSRDAYKGFELHGPDPDYSGYGGPLQGRTNHGNFASWKP